MDLKDEHEVAVTKTKLRDLEEYYQAAKRETSPLKHARQVSLGSIKRMINQMTEEIARYEARAANKQPAG